MQKTVSIIVTGKVQGVFFRESTKDKAKTLGITGTVRNDRDGSVRIVATGTEAQLDTLANWCRTGPPNARVDGVEIKTIPDETFDSFTVKRS